MLKKGFIFLVNAVFIFIVSGLFLYSLAFYCDIDIHTLDYVRSIKNHNIVSYIFVTAILSTVIVMIWRRICDYSLNETVVIRILAFVLLLISFFWILFNDCVPKYDQNTLFQEARKLCGIIGGPYDHSYMTAFKRQRFTTLIIALGIKSFGDSQLGFRLFNLGGAFLVFYSVCTVAKYEKSRGVTVFTAVTLLIFYPVIVYTSYLYGTILSVGFSSLGICSTIAYVKENDSKKWILIILGYVFGFLLHQSGAIACIAGCIYLILNCSSNTIKNVGIVVLTIVVLICSTVIVNYVYEEITDSPRGDSAPVLGTVYMGITAPSVGGGPGATDGSNMIAYEESGRNAGIANAVLKKQIIRAMLEYASGERDILFFFRKIAYQWLEPSFCARKIIHKNDTDLGQPANSQHFMQFYESRFRTIVYSGASYFLSIIYLFSAIAAILKVKQKAYAANLLIYVLFIGGFLFSLIWETLSRYQLLYIIWLIPLACQGVDRLAKKRPAVADR